MHEIDVRLALALADRGTMINQERFFMNTRRGTRLGGLNVVRFGRTYVLAAAASVFVAGVLVALGLTDLGMGFAPAQRIHVATQSCGALVLCIAALLVFKRFQADAHTQVVGLPGPQRLADVVLAFALGLLAATTVLFSAVPAIVATTPGDFAIWGQLCGQLAGVAAVAAAAWIPSSRAIRRPVTTLQTVRLAAAGLLLVALVALAASLLVPAPGHRSATLEAHWLPFEIVLVALMATAFVGLARRAEREGDRLAEGLAVSAPLSAGAVLASAIAPALGVGWVLAEELFALGAYAAILGGAWTQSAAYWGRFVMLAGAEERRSIARDLHDGLAQDLHFIAMETHALQQRHPEAVSLRRLRYASERALDESRGAIGTLSYPPAEPLASVLERSVQEIASRAGVMASVQVAPDVDASLEVRKAVIRIAREATSNAARHGQASQVVVTLRGGRTLRLTITDDGIGFDPDAALRDVRGFGVESMHDRAESAGGTLSVLSRTGEGTAVIAKLPRDPANLLVLG